MCNVGIGLSPDTGETKLDFVGLEKPNVECFRVFPEYQTQDAPTKRNVLEILKEWIKSEEAQLDIVENQDSAQHGHDVQPLESKMVAGHNGPNAVLGTSS